MKIIAFAGSNSSKSINRKLVDYVLTHFEEEDITLLDLNDFEMPIYSIDREKNEGIPDKAKQFRDYFDEADAIVCSLAEHNSTYTVAMKNILDWCSRIDLNIFNNTPMLLMSTSPGGYGGGNVMALAKKFFPKCKADLVGTFSLPSFKDNFSEGKVVEGEFREELTDKIEELKRVLE